MQSHFPVFSLFLFTEFNPRDKRHSRSLPSLLLLLLGGREREGEREEPARTPASPLSRNGGLWRAGRLRLRHEPIDGTIADSRSVRLWLFLCCSAGCRIALRSSFRGRRRLRCLWRRLRWPGVWRSSSASSRIRIRRQRRVNSDAGTGSAAADNLDLRAARFFDVRLWLTGRLWRRRRKCSSSVSSPGH